jgi:TnpA family transposase
MAKMLLGVTKVGRDARAVFFHRLGEIRDRTISATAPLASILRAAIILWNIGQT